MENNINNQDQIEKLTEEVEKLREQIDKTTPKKPYERGCMQGIIEITLLISGLIAIIYGLIALFSV